MFDRAAVKSNGITYVLVASQDERLVFCVNCRFGLFATKGRVVKVEEAAPVDTTDLIAPIKSQCPKCKTYYAIQLIK